MIWRLRMQFVALSMTLVTLLMVGVFCFFHNAAQSSLEATSQEVLERVMDTPISASSSDLTNGDVQMPYFTVSLFSNHDGYAAYITGGTYSDLENSQLLSDIIAICLSQEESQGVVGEYNLRYLRENTGMIERIAFVDTSFEQATLNAMISAYIGIGMAAMLGLLLVAFWLSGWVVRPVKRAWEQQRQFLSDASHELKTPLAVILSNAQLLDTLALEQPGTRWIDNIHFESQKMKVLVEQMLTLARTDQMTTKEPLSPVSLWEVVTDCVLSFEPVAFEAGKPLVETICQEGTVLGDGQKLAQLVSILLDNAVKYGAPGAPIEVNLSKTDKIMRLLVSNQGDVIPPEQLKRLFERFYRTDTSRGEQEGFGLGLAIAHTIVKAHKATIKVESDVHSTRVIVLFPLKKGK